LTGLLSQLRVASSTPFGLVLASLLGLAAVAGRRLALGIASEVLAQRACDGVTPLRPCEWARRDVEREVTWL
jgi:hypothetical protein